jgi:hypothetical protein
MRVECSSCKSGCLVPEATPVLEAETEVQDTHPQHPTQERAAKQDADHWGP